MEPRGKASRNYLIKTENHAKSTFIRFSISHFVYLGFIACVSERIGITGRKPSNDLNYEKSVW
jgi:hypothetical protein